MDTKAAVKQFLSDSGITAADAAAALAQIQNEAAIKAEVELAVAPVRADVDKLAADLAAIPGD